MDRAKSKPSTTRFCNFVRLNFNICGVEHRETFTRIVSSQSRPDACMHGNKAGLVQKVYTMGFSHPEAGNVYDFPVLILGEYGEDGRPSTPDVVPGVDELASRGVDEGIGLEPPGEPTPARPWSALDEVPQE